MKKVLFLSVAFALSMSAIFGQNLPILKVTERDMTGRIFRDVRENETVVEIQSNVDLEFESTMDRGITILGKRNESGYIWYGLLFSTGNNYDGRKLKIKSNGFETYIQQLDLKSKVPVGLLVINETKRKADDYFHSEKYVEAKREYEKLRSINSKDDYVLERITECNAKIQNLGTGTGGQFQQEKSTYSTQRTEIEFTTKKGLQEVTIITSLGNITIALYNETPIHRDNFIKLANSHFYDGVLFHRIIQNFMIQAGDPDSKNAAKGQRLGMSGPGYTLAAEIIPYLKHNRGTVAAARLGDNVNPQRASSGSQFYIVDNVNGATHLDGQYTIFGEVISGMNVVDKIAAQKKDSADRPLEDIKIISMQVIVK